MADFTLADVFKYLDDMLPEEMYAAIKSAYHNNVFVYGVINSSVSCNSLPDAMALIAGHALFGFVHEFDERESNARTVKR